MAWPLFVAAGVLAVSELLPSDKKKVNSTGLASNDSFYSGLLVGLSIGYLITLESQRGRWWAYVRRKARKYLMNGTKTIEEFDGITIEHVVSPKQNVTSGMHVDIITLPPNRELRGKSAGVECYVLWRGSILINNVFVSSNHHVIEPFVQRTLANPSSTTSAVILRSTDGPLNDTIVEKPSIYDSASHYLKSTLSYVPIDLPSWGSTVRAKTE